MGIRQRFLHFYFVNETLNLGLICYVIAYNPVAYYITFVSPTIIGLITYLTIFYSLFALMVGVVALRREFRDSTNVDVSREFFEIPEFERATYTTPDGIQLITGIANRGKPKVMLLACPLGQCGPDIYNPIIGWFGDEFTYITWDYRGFFGSDSPEMERMVSIPDHARDAAAVLRTFGVEKADVCVGHSMGTAVVLELTLLCPQMVGTLILMNGFHGQVFSTAFQPMVRLPFMGDFTAGLVDFLLHHQLFLRAVEVSILPYLRQFLPLFAEKMGSPMLRENLGNNYLLDFAESYLGRLFDEDTNVTHFLRLFQELDAHSVYHLLPTIDHPVLVISGCLDFLTPAMQSVEIARRCQNAEHYCDPFSTHASILESPEWCIAEIHTFLKKHGLATGNTGGKGPSKWVKKAYEKIEERLGIPDRNNRRGAGGDVDKTD